MKVDGPGPIPKDALQYFRAKVSTPEFDYRDIWREEHAHAFTVAKATQTDVLDSIRESLDKALAEGRTFRQFAKELTPELQRMGWWGRKRMSDPLTGETVVAQLGSPRRLKTIYRANMSTARTAGQWARAQRTKAAMPYLLYELGPSREHREEHVAWHGTLLPMDDPWWDTHMPRNGWGCKCRVRQVGRVEYDRLKENGTPGPIREQVINPETGLPTGHVETRMVPVKTEAPEIRMVDWKNKRTGLTEKVPAGIDPGWDTNPGKVRQQSLENLLAGKINAMPDAARTVAVKDLAASGRFGKWVDNVVASGQTKGQVQIVGAVDETTLNFLAGKGVDLEAQVIDIDDKGILHSVRAAKKDRGAALDLETLKDLPTRLLTAERFWDTEDPALVYAFDVPGDGSKIGKAVVRVNFRRKGEITNRVATTGIVKPFNLESGDRYEKIGARN